MGSAHLKTDVSRDSWSVSSSNSHAHFVSLDLERGAVFERTSEGAGSEQIKVEVEETVSYLHHSAIRDNRQQGCQRRYIRFPRHMVMVLKPSTRLDRKILWLCLRHDVSVSTN